MGASVSGHSSHPEHSARFKRVVGGNRSPCSSRCRMCQLNVDVGAAAYYRCSEPDCAVVVHESCYRRPKTIKGHFAHPPHRLKLGGDITLAGLPCSICAQELGTPPVAYSCTRSRSRCATGFHAHPRCCGLPRDMSAPPELKHERHGNLVLLPPLSGGKGNGGDERRRRGRLCLKCNKRAAAAATGSAAPWSYQCPKCDDVEYCLGCVLGNDDGRSLRCCCFPCCDVDPAVVGCLGHLAGVFCCAFLSGMGCPGVPTQLYPGGMATPKVSNVTGNPAN